LIIATEQAVLDGDVGPSLQYLWLLVSWRRQNRLLSQKAHRFLIKNHPTRWIAAYFIWENKI